MVRARSVASTVVASAVLSLAVACGGRSSGNSATGGTGGSACDRLFDLFMGTGTCPAQTPLPADELSRLRPRFEQSCQNALSLPGSGLTSGTLSACVSALQALPCGSTTDNVPACQFTGSLAAGTSCISGEQCQSGSCIYSGSGSPDGGVSTPSCGACSTLAQVGGACGDNQTCAPGSACVPGAGTATCTAITHGAAGASCDDIEALCADGLYCDATTRKCTATKASGAPCSGSNECTPPLVCGGASPVGMGTTCQSAGQAGTGCSFDEQCASGLGCDSSKNQCATVSWASAGQPCGGGVRCLVGSCPPSASGASSVCPKVIPDGQPCKDTDPTTTCDTFSSCVGGTCLLSGSQTCM